MENTDSVLLKKKKTKKERTVEAVIFEKVEVVVYVSL